MYKVSTESSTPSSRDSTWNGKPAPSPYLHKQLDVTVSPQAFDFVTGCPVDLPGCCFCSFSKLGSRMIVGWRHAGLWEAGANPALPRNCKRGHRNRSLGISEKDNPGKAGCSSRMLGQSSFEQKAHILTRKARKPARTIT